MIDGENPEFKQEDLSSLFVAPSYKDEKFYGDDDSGFYGMASAAPAPTVPPPEGRCTGQILQLKNGYGFLGTDFTAKNLFFFWEDLEGLDFNELALGEHLEFEFGTNERGECARHITRPGCYPPPAPEVPEQPAEEV